MKILFTILAGIFLLAGSVAALEAEWLIMVYLDADNNLDPYGKTDIEEMETVGSNDQIKIAVLMDRYDKKEWASTRRFLVRSKSELGDKQRSWDPALDTCEDIGEVNMGDPQTLTDFISWAREKYPAKKSLLVLWNHGGGWRDVYSRAVSRATGQKDVSPGRLGHSPFSRGIAWDDSNGNDFLEMREVRGAMEPFPPFDIIGADACLMGMLEVGYELREQGNYMVASEDLEPGDGWPYHTLLEALQANPQMDAVALSKTIVQVFADDYESRKKKVTLSAVDLQALTPLANEVSQFADEVIRAAQASGDKGKVSLKKMKVPAFPSYSKEFVDLDAVLEKFEQSGAAWATAPVKQAAGRARQALKAAVIFNHSHPDLDGRGLTIFSGEGADQKDYNADIIEFARDTRWDEMLTAFVHGQAVAESEEIEEEPFDRYAVLIGVEKYEDPNISELEYAVDDVTRLRDVLIRHAGYPEDHIMVITNQAATTEKLRSTLGTWLPRQAGEDDMVLIYFSGHGGAEPALHEGMDDGTEKYMMLTDSKVEDMYGTALPMSELARIIDRIRADKLMLVMDACYSGASGGRGVMRRGMKAIGLSDTYMESLTGSQGTVVLTASKASEISMESPTYKQGIFTYHLCEALSGKADTDKNRVVTLTEVYAYVSKEVPDEAKRMGASQHPIMRGEFTGQFPLARMDVEVLPGKPVESVPPPRPATPPPPVPTAPVPVVKPEIFKPLKTQPTLVVTSATTRYGKRLVARYSGFAPKNTSAWIGFYRVDATSKDYLHYTFLNNLANQSYDVAVPKESGTYQFRIFADEGYQPVAVSPPYVVK